MKRQTLLLMVRAVVMMPTVIRRLVWIRSPVLIAIFVLSNLIGCKTATGANSAANQRALPAACKSADQRSADGAAADDLRGGVVITVGARILTAAILSQSRDRT
jgi:hypothetical protein